MHSEVWPGARGIGITRKLVQMENSGPHPSPMEQESVFSQDISLILMDKFNTPKKVYFPEAEFNSSW
jgi:hypothetical protein